MSPFGPGNPEPLFAFSGMRVVEALPMKGGHVRATLADPDGARIRAVAWRAGESPFREEAYGTRFWPAHCG